MFPCKKNCHLVLNKPEIHSYCNRNAANIIFLQLSCLKAFQ